MDEAKWRSEAIRLLHYASGSLEGFAWQVEGELKDRITSAFTYIKSETDSLMEKSEEGLNG